MITPYPYQTENAEALVKIIGRFGSAIDASDMGTGKTITALVVAKQLGVRPAIICPAPVVDSWLETAQKMGVEPLFVTNYERIWRPGFKWGGYTKKSYYWPHVPVETLFIFDEAQRCRGGGEAAFTPVHRKSHNAQALLGAAYRCRTLLLSATPWIDPLDAQVLGQVLRLFRPSDYMKWLFAHGVRKNQQRKWVFKGGTAAIDKVHKAMFPEHGVRTRCEDIPGFPETQIFTRLIDVPDANIVTETYESALKERSATDNPEDKKTILLRARQFAEIRKVPVLAEMAEDMHKETNWPVAVFLNFDASVEIFAKLVGCKDFITGEQTRREKHATATRFQWGKVPYLACNIQAGGVGISLHDKTGKGVPRGTLLSPGWSALDLRQSLGRVRRDGGARSVQTIVCVKNTVEEFVHYRVTKKLDCLDTLVDGDLEI